MISLFMGLTIGLAGCRDAEISFNPETLDLKGQHNFSTGDQLEWANPNFDDREWKTIDVPGGWNTSGVDWSTHYGWYRIRFDTHQLQKLTQPALFANEIMRADEVFLNGKRIGGTGLNGTEIRYVPWMPRLYKLPEELLNQDGQANLLAIRVFSPFQVYEDGGILGETLVIGNFPGLLQLAEKQRRTQQLSEMMILSFLSLFTLSSIWLWIVQIRKEEMMWVTIGGFYMVIDLYLLSPLSTSDPIRLACPDWLIFLIDFLAVPLLLSIVGFLLERTWSLFSRWMAGMISLVSLLYIPLAYTQSYFQVALAAFLVLATMVYCGYLIGISFKNFRSSPHTEIAITAGILLTLVCFFVEMVSPASIMYQQGIYLTKFGTIFFIVGFFGTVILRYRDALLQSRNVSSSVLEAQEKERSRLGRELHDGIVQSVLAVQLNLELLNARQQTNQTNDEVDQQVPLENVIQEVRQISQEIRRVSRDLRPETLERMTLTEALQYHLESLQPQTGLEFDFQSTQTASVDLRVQENLYRIFQESIRNVIRHAEATTVKVLLTDQEEELVLSIQDNGRGLDHHQPSAGVGLAIIRERAVLLGGVATITSSPGKGTTVKIRVPRLQDPEKENR